MELRLISEDLAFGLGMRPTSSIIEEKPERFSLSYDRIYLIGSVSCKWRYQPKLIHSLLGDSYGCVNHACGAINPPSRVGYISCTMRTRRFQSRV